jgi:hypothetical protein
MFNKTDNDLTRTLVMMIDRSIDECRSNQTEAVKKTAQWIAQDRRFDSYDPHAVAREAFDAKLHGRRMELNKPLRLNTTPPPYSGPL